MKNRTNLAQIALLGMLMLYGVLIAAAFHFHMLSMPFTSVLQIAMDLFTMALGIVLFVAGEYENKKAEILGVWHTRMVVTVYCALIFDALSWILDGHPEVRIGNIIANTFLYLSAPFVTYEFCAYLIEYLEISDNPGVKRFFKVMRIGCGVSIFLILFNLVYPIYFTVDSAGVYSRQFLFVVSNIYPYGGALLVVGVMIAFRKKVLPYQMAILGLFVFAPVIGITFTVLFYGLTPVHPTMMTVLMIFYCVLNVEKSRARSTVEAELAMATRIQADMLPNLFPAFPERKEFDLFASMNPAKEVGGDFYDFFLIDDDHIGFVMADVSGKGVPAAMFMMFTKNIIANNAMMGKSPAVTLRDANDEVCLSNSEDMFVTVWIGIMTISTGRMVCSSAGHEYPVVKHGDGGFELLKDKHGMAVGFIDGAEYEEYDIQFEPGDKFFIYTDGVPEATRADRQMYGTDRIVETLNRNLSADPEQMLTAIWNDVAIFIDGADQFDDLTMLAIEYKGAIA